MTSADTVAGQNFRCAIRENLEKIKDENNGRLDVLVNNAYAGVDMIFSNARKKFHEMTHINMEIYMLHRNCSGKRTRQQRPKHMVCS